MTFHRTSCDCAECVECCVRQPGPLAPGDYKRIADFLGEPNVDAYFWASPGALVLTAAGVARVGTITPRRTETGCVFLVEGRCRIHEVAPAGCALFDTHMDAAEGSRRANWLVAQQMDPHYQALRAELEPATTWMGQKIGG